MVFQKNKIVLFCLKRELKNNNLDMIYILSEVDIKILNKISIELDHLFL